MVNSVLEEGSEEQLKMTPHHDPSEGNCRLIDGPFASFIQACLAIVCIGTLIIKRQQESPRREVFVWFLDVMKQGDTF
jgi:hypothetical protein